MALLQSPVSTPPTLLCSSNSGNTNGTSTPPHPQPMATPMANAECDTVSRVRPNSIVEGKSSERNPLRVTAEDSGPLCNERKRWERSRRGQRAVLCDGESEWATCVASRES